MSDKLSEEMKIEIMQEGKDYAHNRFSSLKDKKHLQRQTLMMYAYWEGGQAYAEKWQAAEQRAEKYEKALKDIFNPIGYLQRKSDEENARLDGHQAILLANSVSFIQNIAREALTPKTSGDDKA